MLHFIHGTTETDRNGNQKVLTMIDFDSVWRTQDEIRTVVNAVLGECIWNLSYSEQRRAIVLELTVTLDDEAIDELSCQFSEVADYDGVGSKGTKFVFYL